MQSYSVQQNCFEFHLRRKEQKQYYKYNMIKSPTMAKRIAHKKRNAHCNCQNSCSTAKKNRRRACSQEELFRPPEVITNIMFDTPEEQLEKEFCKNYCSIQPDEKFGFEERMKFDIYKRATKESRLEILREMREPKISSEEVRNIVKRFQQDTERRWLARKNLETIQAEEEKQLRSEKFGGTRKISKVESDRFYARQIEAQKEKNAELMLRRNQLKEIKEQEETKELYSAYRSTPISNYELKGMLKRFDDDMRRRKETILRKQEELQILKEEEERTWFRPRINSPSSVLHPNTYQHSRLEFNPNTFTPEEVSSPQLSALIEIMKNESLMNESASLQRKITEALKEKIQDNEDSPVEEYYRSQEKLDFSSSSPCEKNSPILSQVKPFPVSHSRPSTTIRQSLASPVKKGLMFKRNPDPESDCRIAPIQEYETVIRKDRPLKGPFNTMKQYPPIKPPQVNPK